MTLLTIDEFAKWVKVHPMTIYGLVKRKEIPAIKVGGQWRILKEAFEAKFGCEGE